MWHGMDKRRFPRADYQCLITIIKKGTERNFLTHTQNIGMGGICVVLNEALGLFSHVDIELMLKDEEEPIKCKGNIAWVIKKTEIKNVTPVTNFDTGIEFVDLKENDKKRIEKIVQYIIQKETFTKKGEER